MQTKSVLVAGCVAILLQCTVATSPGASFTNSGTILTISNGQKTLTWPRLPALDTNRLATGSTVTAVTNNQPSTNIARSSLIYQWGTSNNLPEQFYAIEQRQMNSNDLLTANILNRLAYGPTPDDLERVRAIGPQSYVDEQVAPQTIPNTYDTYSVVQTNGVTLPPNTNWSTISVTGTVSIPTGGGFFYMYLLDPGDVYIDDVRLSLVFTNRIINCTTNFSTNASPPFDVTTNIVCTTNLDYYAGPNALVNGDFEQTATPPLNPVPNWIVGTNYLGSAESTTYSCSGTQSLHMVCTARGQGANHGTDGSSIQQSIAANKLTNGHRCVLSFAYLPKPNTHLITMRLSGSGIITTAEDEPDPPTWIYATATGRATGTPSLYVYISGAGEAWVDDLKLVNGTVAGAGSNLAQNGDFEQPLTNGWIRTTDFTNSYTDTTVSHSGASSLHIVATAGGQGNGDSIYQVVPVTNNGIYTVSFWYRPATRGRTLTVRLSGSLLAATPDSNASGLRRRLDAANWGVTLNEMRMWFCANGVNSPRQLLEVLSQFFENHFVTYHSKTADYFDRYYDGTILDQIATDLEYREMSRWRAALLNPNCTFYDLLKIHVESPAEIIYLDTVESRGDGNNVANENYARELFELFTMGVDNGYEQNDIVAMSRAWTGWTVELVDRDQINNPFAPRTLQFGNYDGQGFNAVSNLVGVWTFSYNTNWHGTNRASILSVWDPNGPPTNPVAIGPKLYAARFGPPWAGQPYQISIPRRTGTNGIQDGYDVIANLANNIHTAEYLSVKLCRIFIHDNFPNPTTRPELPEYAFYDYRSSANATRTPEAELVRKCIVAWDTVGSDGRKGHIYSVLQTIFNSDLFRSHGGSRQKVKTPLEFVLSAIRALKSVDSSGAATAFTDGDVRSAIGRMGNMRLFDRADPDGYPEAGPPWISAGTLAERLRFVQVLCTDVNSRTNTSGGTLTDAGNNTVDPVSLLKRKLPQTSWTNAPAVADLFLTYLLFGEGQANLDLYRQAAIDFLNDGSTDTGGPTARRFDQLDPNTSTSYPTRVRGMVSLLMTTQRFQEQ